MYIILWVNEGGKIQNFGHSCFSLA